MAGMSSADDMVQRPQEDGLGNSGSLITSRSSPGRDITRSFAATSLETERKAESDCRDPWRVLNPAGDRHGTLIRTSCPRGRVRAQGLDDVESSFPKRDACA